MESGWVTFLKADATLTTLLAGRIFPEAAPVGTEPPYLVYTVPLDEPYLHMRGACDLNQCMIENTVFGETKVQAKAITKRMKDLLKDFQPTTWGNFEVQSARITDGRSGAESPRDDSDAWDYSDTVTLSAAYKDVV